MGSDPPVAGLFAIMSQDRWGSQPDYRKIAHETSRSATDADNPRVRPAACLALIDPAGGNSIAISPIWVKTADFLALEFLQTLRSSE
jgi:hypothetical protein